MHKLLFILSIFCLGFSTHAQKTATDLLPLPQKIELQTGFFSTDSTIRVFAIGAQNSKIQKAIDRFFVRFSKKTFLPIKYAQSAEKAQIIVRSDAKNLAPEAYEISISNQINIRASSSIGVMHALESLIQLAEKTQNGVRFAQVRIEDWPRFPWRGMMVDVARHFIPMDVMKRNVDAMATSKMNILHLHLTDDEGFRIESKRWPKLHQMGSKGKYYTQAEMHEFITYCADRGIEVYPEFDLPGHSQSWFAGYPELAAEKKVYEPGLRFKNKGDQPLTVAAVMQMMNSSPLPTIDPTQEFTYQFLEEFLKEMKGIFPHGKVHIGVDESNGVAWKNNPSIVRFMAKNKIKDVHALQDYFASRMIKINQKLGFQTIAWEEAFNEHTDKNLIVQLWKPGGMMGAGLEVDKVTTQGNKAIVSRGFYLDTFLPAYVHYLNDPMLKVETSAKLLGGEAAIWTEIADEFNFENRVWPRAAAIAERLWSSQSTQNIDDLYRRLIPFSHQLSWNGLAHLKSANTLLDEYANGSQGSANELLSILSPIKGYRRLMTRMLSPQKTQVENINQLADILPVDSEKKWAFREKVSEYLSSHSEVSKVQIMGTLLAWKNIQLIENQLGNTFQLKNHAQNISTISGKVLELMQNEHSVDKDALLKQISLTKKVQDHDVELAVLEELEALVTGKLKAPEMKFSLF
jgi:hexosaminidase